MQLRQATQAAHQRLDAAAGSLPLESDRDYATFLSAQFIGRVAMEGAFESLAPGEIGAPPKQSSLIASDLRDLGFCVPTGGTPPRLGDRRAALGAAWVVAGSSLGNRAILSRRRKLGLRRAERFLSDDGMPVYFKRLCAVMESPHSCEDLDAATSGAHQAFALFEDAFAQSMQDQAA